MFSTHRAFQGCLWLSSSVELSGITQHTSIYKMALDRRRHLAVSSSMNSLAAITWKDICENRFKNSSELRRTIFTKLLCMIVKYANPMGQFINYQYQYIHMSFQLSVMALLELRLDTVFSFSEAISCRYIKISGPHHITPDFDVV